MSEARAAAAKPKLAQGRLIEVRGLDKTFYDADREIRVLRGLDLTVQAGEEIAIVGQSGTGKSTLARALAPELGPAPGALIPRSDEIRKRLFGVLPEAKLPPQAYAASVSAQVFGELARQAEAASGRARAPGRDGLG